MVGWVNVMLCVWDCGALCVRETVGCKMIVMAQLGIVVLRLVIVADILGGVVIRLRIMMAVPPTKCIDATWNSMLLLGHVTVLL